MTIHILAVEDDPSFADLLAGLITEQGPDVSVQIARSSGSALNVIESDSFDLIVLDLKIPTLDGALDADVEHGRSVLYRARSLAPGTPLLVLTGSPAENFVENFLDLNEQVDIWGEQEKVSTIRFLRKSHLDRLQELLTPSIRAIRAVEDVEIRRTDDMVNLTWEEDRLVRILVRRCGGSSCLVNRIGGGLSGASVFRVTVLDGAGTQILNAVTKIGSHEMVRAEMQNYRQHAHRLNEQATPRLLEDVRYGGAESAAIAYRLAHGFNSNLFELAVSSPDLACEVVQRAAVMVAPWSEGVVESTSTIEDVRRRLLSDKRAEALFEQYGLTWARDLERRRVQLRWCPIHGDLHGGNILVDHAGTPILIDYGDMGPGPAALDWVTLELSAIFHVDGWARNTGWPDPEACDSWADSGEFGRGSRAPALVTACRDAARAVGVGPRELAACSYAYVLRQLAYEDTDKAMALRILEAARRFIVEQT